MATILGGRFIVKEIHPLSFSEYLSAGGITLEKNWAYSSQRFDIRKKFNDFFYFGGLPEILQFKDKRLWLRGLYNKIFFG